MSGIRVFIGMVCLLAVAMFAQVGCGKYDSESCEPSDEICDGKDNDCDGLTDENASGDPLSNACYSGPAGTEGVGECRVGTAVCTDGQWAVCQNEVIPALEVCDELDNDCDGVVDAAWFECSDGTTVPLCWCDQGTNWVCMENSENQCHDPRCDDGTEPMCEMPVPECQEWEILAYQNSCHRCVNPETCVPWGEPGCRNDGDCPPEEYCNPCGSSSCPICNDCVPACRPHGCQTQPEPGCNLIRPDCGEGQVAVVREDCWVCVDLETCESPVRDEHCDDGTEPVCLMPVPECQEWEILAYQDNCYRCVNPETCVPWGEPGCENDEVCSVEEYCDSCGSSSCPDCEDCVPACQPHNCETETELYCFCIRPECGPDGVAVIQDGCYVCVYLDTCLPTGESC